VTPRAGTPTPDSTCRADSFSFPSCGNAASYVATTSRATDQSRPSKRLGTYIVCEKRLSLPFQLFYNFNLESFNSLDCSRICLKKTHSSTHLKIPFLYWILYLRSPSLNIQCLPSNESFPLRAKNSGTRLILITLNKF
jgi:hypothetical protein